MVWFRTLCGWRDENLWSVSYVFSYFLSECSPTVTQTLSGSFPFIKYSTTTSVHRRRLLQKSASLRGPVWALLFGAHSQLKSSFTFLLRVIKPACGSSLRFAACKMSYFTKILEELLLKVRRVSFWLKSHWNEKCLFNPFISHPGHMVPI